MDEVVIQLLEQGEIETEGLLPWGSNYTFLVRVCHDSEINNAVYKPRKGERPLWDFARGTLCQRERAAYLISEALNWELVPPTVIRSGPHGPGSLQLFIEHDPEQHYFTFEGRYRPQLQRVCLFDILINNADRKSGHVLLGEEERLWAIDHGVCFHADNKLRTVIWEFAAEPVPSELLSDLSNLLTRLSDRSDPLVSELGNLLSEVEIKALADRVRKLIRMANFPEPGPGRHYPWPPV